MSSELEFLDPEATRLTASALEFASGAEKVSVPLEQIHHVERIENRVVLRWGITDAHRRGHLNVKTGVLTSGDWVDQIEQHLDKHVPGHLFSIADQDGIRYSRTPDFAALAAAGGLAAATLTFRGKGVKDGVVRAETDGNAFRIENLGAYLAYAEGDPSPRCMLMGNELVAANGLSLGTHKERPAGGVAVSLGDGTLVETLASSGVVMRSGEVIGRFRRLTLAFDAPQPELIGLGLLLGFMNGRLEVVVEDRDRRLRTIAWCLFVGLGLSMLVERFARHWMPPMLPLGLSVLVCLALLRRQRKDKELAGPPPRDLAQRREGRKARPQGPDPDGS